MILECFVVSENKEMLRKRKKSRQPRGHRSQPERCLYDQGWKCEEYIKYNTGL